MHNPDAAIDVDALREKYAEERDRRLRPDGIAQYVEVAGPFASFAEDPWSETGFTRPPLHDEVDVAIIGAGFGGLLTGARLRESGVQNIRLIDKAADVGGTWYWNRYPGIACDVESYVYMPLLEELGYIPTEKYAKGDEIFAHCRRIAEHYDLYRDACLRTEVTEMRWDDADSRWIIATNHGDSIRARFVSMANGYLQKPKLPGIEGIMDFRGHAFHTSRWDYGYTGADLANLAGRRVGIIGTGATAIQCVPHLGRSVGRLLVFQRTPSTVDVRGNRPTDPQWSAELKNGWQRHRIENFQLLTAGGEADEDLVSDAWTSIVKKLFVMRQTQCRGNVGRRPFACSRTRRLRQNGGDSRPRRLDRGRPRHRRRRSSRGTATSASDRASTTNTCRRSIATMSTLVDTRGRGVERITADGVVVDGVEHPVDCLIFATGFEVGTDYSRRTGFELVGRDGLTLTEKWRDGVRTLHGVSVRGFPNSFVLSIAQSGFTVNFPYLLDVQATHAAGVIAWALNSGIERLEASVDAETAWVDTIVERSAASAQRAKACTPGYYNREGQANAKTRQGSFFYGSPTEYADMLAASRSNGAPEGYETS